MNMRADSFMVPQPQYYDQIFGGYGSGANLMNTNPVVQPNATFGNSLSPFPGQATPTNSFGLDNMLGPNGWGGLALGVGQGLFSGYLGLQQLGMAKKAFGENQRQFNLNYDAQRRTTNSALEDRQRARLASNAGAYESVGSYMDRNGVK